ncbi:MAG: elongation factor 4 [Candidatus Niyogibacteria bacterium CG10_big_fil_rev_8_21_14_0_10_46_36]|uniref:Elongation factor 4 n=1 Tax=Candidatus Niyogibacteria bacterium CG10_big_fil_rev_8_21_14_0_10_46_36 TaxID=1974726 RepID=A0A2H0TCC0_9BACT|nr:MAG: elongation factor 4 [Candidatus Niyogibacteria bacterium CG10_big_fil_rev_8_21_14_0_10_46_36]
MNIIRNFCIISHIDHGKSTLADRLLEVTGTVEKRKMREQFLDAMDIERERGITIKMQPVRMRYRASESGPEYVLNLIDTPGHIDFSYEVSRSLAAVEGAILLVDASQGIQAQTLSNVELARGLDKTIIPVVNKIDLPHARIQETKEEITALLGTPPEDILEISGKTGQGVPELLDVIVSRIPQPAEEAEDRSLQALIFDFEYSSHQGVIAYVRVVRGTLKKGVKVLLAGAGHTFEAGEVGVFLPDRHAKEMLSPGEIGYVVTNIKKPETVTVGDTVTYAATPAPLLEGYKKPVSMVWANVYPIAQDDFDDLKKALDRLHLEDSSFSYEEESGALGRGFSCGFLGLLHIEIIIERIRREFNIDVVITSPTVNYQVTLKNGKTHEFHSPSEFPEDHEIQSIREPWASFSVLTPPSYLGALLSLLEEYEVIMGETTNVGSRLEIRGEMPLRELMRDFYNRLKSVTSGYASLDYALADMRDAKVIRIDVLIHGEIEPPFSRIVSERRVEREARALVEKLKKILPRELFAYKIQAQARGRIIASEGMSALKKDVTGYLYGGDRTRKMKLWQKQKKGKKRLKESGAVTLPHDVFIKAIQN